MKYFVGRGSTKNVKACVIIVYMNGEKTPSSNNNIRYPNRIITRDIFDLMMQSISEESDPLLQLDNLHDMSELMKITHLGNKEIGDLSSVLREVHSKDNTPLVSLSLEYLTDCLAMDYSLDNSIKPKISKSFLEDIQNQEMLREKFPALSDEYIILRMAPGVAYTLDHYHGMKDVALEGAATTLAESEGHKDPFIALIGQGQDNAVPLWVLTFAHDVRFCGLIEEKLGVELADIPLDSQMQLLEYMTLSDNKRFDKLCSVLKNLEPSLRLNLAKNFVAADFGEDFGDALLDIANSDKISGEQLGEILDKISSCRKSIHDITGFYDGFDDGEFAKQYERAANERLTDALAVFREIAKTGHVSADLGWAGTPEFNYETAMEALDYETKSLEIINGTLSDIGAKKEGAFAERILTPDEYRKRSEYRLYSPDHGYVLLYTRSEGSGTFNSDLEYGKRGNKYRYNNSSGVEASISFITNPKNPFRYPNPHKPDFKKVKEDEDYYDPETMDKVSAMRLDLEGRAPGAPADDPNRDPVNAICTVSVDLAAINDRWDTPSGKIARLFSVGGALRTKLTGTESALNHNTHYFDQDKYGRASGFKELVDYTDNIVLEWCKDAPLDRRYDNALLTIRKMPDSQLKEIIRVYNGLSSDEKERVNGILPIEMVRKEMKRRAGKRGKVASGAFGVAAKKSV